MLTIRDFCLKDASPEPLFEVGEVVHSIPDNCDRLIRGRVFSDGKWIYWIWSYWSSKNRLDIQVDESLLRTSRTKLAQRTILPTFKFSEGQYVKHRCNSMLNIVVWD